MTRFPGVIGVAWQNIIPSIERWKELLACCIAGEMVVYIGLYKVEKANKKETINMSLNDETQKKI